MNPQTFNSTEAVKDVAEEEGYMDEKSPSVTSMTKQTLFRQKSMSFTNSEKQEEHKEKDSAQVHNMHAHISDYLYIVCTLLIDWKKSNKSIVCSPVPQCRRKNFQKRHSSKC